MNEIDPKFIKSTYFQKLLIEKETCFDYIQTCFKQFRSNDLDSDDKIRSKNYSIAI